MNALAAMTPRLLAGGCPPAMVFFNLLLLLLIVLVRTLAIALWVLLQERATHKRFARTLQQEFEEQEAEARKAEEKGGTPGAPPRESEAPAEPGPRFPH